MSFLRAIERSIRTNGRILAQRAVQRPRARLPGKNKKAQERDRAWAKEVPRLP
jgi:hypothetical protein